jgi:hypothetical protein
MNAARRAKLAALADLHDMWVTKNTEAASAAFDPKGRPAKSVYNQHHVDLDADGAAQDRYAAGAARVLAAAGDQTAAYATPGAALARGNWIKPPNQSASVHEFCRNPLHPGPCKGWKQAKAAGRDTSVAHPDIAPPQRTRPKKAVSAGPGLAALVRSPVVSRRRLGGGMMGETDLVEFADGRKAVRKTFERSRDVRDPIEQADAEQLAVLVSRAAGVRAPEVVRTKRDEIHMEHIEGTTGADVVPWGESVPAGLPETDEGRLLGLVDALVANTDRNAGNYILNPDGSLKAGIDHGSAFDTDEVMNYRLLEANPFSSHYVRAEADGSVWAPVNDMSKADMSMIRDRLQALRGDFQDLDRLGWWESMMRRMDVLSAAATGERNRLS